MDRIAELLAKGIENLDDDELAELRTLCHEEADARLDADDDADETLAELESIAETLDAVKAEEVHRAEVKAAKAEQRQALAERIRNEGGTDDGDNEESEGEGDADADASLEDTDTEDTEVEAEAPVPAGVAATTPPASPVVTRVAARRPATHAPRRTNVRQAALTASANVPGMPAGIRLDTNDRIHQAFTSAANLAASSQTKIKLPVATLRADIPEDLILDRDAQRNEEKIEARTSMAAITAAGGVCAPVPYRYDLPVVGDDARPVREALARFGAVRGGIRTLTPPTITDVEGAIGWWTHANDLEPADPTTKPYLTILCDDTEATTMVTAITQSFKVGNFRDRWFPEQIRAYLDLTNTYHARYADARLLAAITAGSKVVTHGQLLGSAQDIFTSLRQLIMGIRYRHRIPDAQRFRVIGFNWVRDNIITDLVRKGPGDLSVEERLRMAESAIDAFFTSVNCNIAWSPDFEWGVALGSPGGPPAGVQGVGPVIGYPSVARFYVHLEGSWLFLDGGQLDLGVIRDATLVGTNDMLMFSETFEAAHYHGTPGESYVYDIDICANGGYASPLDIDPCVGGS